MKTVMAPHTATVHMVSSGSVIKNDRRASKPLMEKRRRERINKSLNELKSILLNALRKDQSTCHSKLEKADILEMTVRYLRGIQRQRLNAAMALDPSIVSKYRNGYMECKSEVSHFLENSENVQTDVKARLMNHLGSAPQTHLPPHMMGQNPAPRLLTTAPPVPAVNAISPLQIQMSPNTQIQQAMAAAAAAMAQSRNMMPHHGMHFNMPESVEARFREAHSASPESPAQSPRLSQISPNSHPERRSPTGHVRHNSGSSFASSGFASPGSPLSLSSSTSPQKLVCESVAKRNIQGSFVLIPQSSTAAIPPPPMPVAMETEQSRASASSPRRNYPAPCISPISPASSPLSISKNSAVNMTSSPMSRPFSPTSTAGSDSDSDPVWRPW